MATQTTFDETCMLPVASASAAQFRSLRSAVAVEFFERVMGAACDPSLRSGEAWGAFEDRAEVIAVCAVARASESSCRAQVAVVPERRRLGIGRDLVELAMAQVARLGARTLLGSHRAGAADAHGLVASMDVTCARRVQDGQVEVVLYLPTPTSSPQEGKP